MEIQNSTSNRINDRISNGYQVRMSQYLGMALNLIKQNMGLFISFTLIYIAFLVMVWRLGEIGSYVNIIFSGPITAGYYIMIHRMISGQPFSFENFFDGFKIFLPVMAASMASGLLTSLGALLFIVPGLIIAILLIFVSPLVIFGRLDTLSALKYSTMIVWRQFWDITKFALLIALINLSTVFTFGIAFIFTLPMSFAAVYFAYVDIVGINDEKPKDIKPDFSHFR